MISGHYWVTSKMWHPDAVSALRKAKETFLPRLFIFRVALASSQVTDITSNFPNNNNKKDCTSQIFCTSSGRCGFSGACKLSTIHKLSQSSLPSIVSLIKRVTVTEGGKLFSTGPLCSWWWLIICGNGEKKSAPRTTVMQRWHFSEH